MSSSGGSFRLHSKSASGHSSPRSVDSLSSYFHVQQTMARITEQAVAPDCHDEYGQSHHNEVMRFRRHLAPIHGIRYVLSI